MKKKQTLSPKIDIVFQALFGEVGSERITKRFLQNILDDEIKTIDLSKNPILRREFKNDKLGILDIIAEINGNKKCNIEIQLIGKENILDRLLFYWSKLYSKQIKSGNDYDKLQKTIGILIANFELDKLDELEYISKWKIIEEKHRKVILTDKLEIYIIELPKITKETQSNSELLDWLFFLENPNSERIQEKMKSNKELREAKQKLDEMSEDEKMQRIAELRQKAIWDENSLKTSSFKAGVKKEKEETTKKMLQKKIKIELISEITGLTKEEIDEIIVNSNIKN